MEFLPHQYLLAGCAIFAAHVVSTVTGFGANIVALPLLALVVGLAPGKVAVVVLSTLLYGVLTARWWHRVALRQLVVIVVVTGVGLAAGMRFFELLPPTASVVALGVFVALVGLQGLVRPNLLKHVPDPVAKVMLFVGGVVHGAFTVGGPLMVIYCRRAIPDKTTFRSTLSVMWVVLNLGLIAGWALRRNWPAGTTELTLVGLPFTFAGLVAGEWIHHKVDAKTFGRWVNVLLIATGVMLTVSALS